MAEQAGTNKNRQGNPNPKPTDPNGPQKPTHVPDDDAARQQLHALGVDVSAFKTEQLRKVWGQIPDAVKTAAAAGDLYAKQDLEQLFQDTNTGSRLQNFNKYYTDAPYMLGPEATGAQRTQAQAQAGFDIGEWKKLPPEVLQQNLDTFFANPGAARFYTEDQVNQLRALAGRAAATGGAGLYTPFTAFTGTQEGVPGYAGYMTSARDAFASHYSAAAYAGDFEGANKAMSALQAHDAYHNTQEPQATYTGPDTFSENDLYQ